MDDIFFGTPCGLKISKNPTKNLSNNHLALCTTPTSARHLWNQAERMQAVHNRYPNGKIRAICGMGAAVAEGLLAQMPNLDRLPHTS